MQLGIDGRAYVVTGASRGIGAATARLLAAESARVLAVARGAEALERVAAECGDGVVPFALDVTAPDAGERVRTACREHFGRVDGLVNNAGVTRAIPPERLRDADWQQQWDLHVMAPMRLMRATAPAMADAGWGRIVNVCSSSGKRPSLRNMAYSVTKAAQLSLSRAFADEWAGRGVLVNAVAPGVTATSMWLDEGGLVDQVADVQGTDREQVLAELGRKVPLGRVGTEGEIAAVIGFLCSELASNVAGAAWSVDGGAVPTIV
jgi:3-oxoacyl-[acyl-carrier protein] reductase